MTKNLLAMKNYKFGEGNFYVKSICKFNGIEYREVLPYGIDPECPDNIICITSDFGAKLSFNKEKIVSLKDSSINWKDFELK